MSDPTEQTVIEYPSNLSGIPFASFLQIEKYSYDEAQKKVAQSQNDALASLENSAIGGLVDGAVNTVANTYGAGEENLGNQSFKSAKKNFFGQRRNIELSEENANELVIVNGKEVTIGSLLKEKQAKINRKNKGLMSSKCMLPLPNEFQYKYGADWNNEFKLGTLALAADDAGRFGAIVGAGGIIGGSAQAIVNSLTGKDDNANNKNKRNDNVEKIIDGAVGGMKKAADPFKMNSELNPKNVAGLAGLAPNENSIQFFQRMQGRQFTFRFELAARNKQESNKIITIIEWFKRGMHPDSKSGRGSAVMLTFPDVFILTPKFVQCDDKGKPVGDPIQHPMMPKTKLCALTGLSINTTPFGQLQTVFDGTIPVVTMELMFMETTKLTRVDMEGASFSSKKKTGILPTLSKGSFTKDASLDNTGDVSF
tara:strand:- start:1263 stop:2534 length:1272 start_codon:yes stop_codon:yes gene_type:complete